jgi:hypothetical protein
VRSNKSPGGPGRTGEVGEEGFPVPPAGLRGSLGGRQGKWKPLRRYRGAACSEPDRNSLSHQAARLIHHSCRFLGHGFLTRFTATVAAIVRVAARRDKRWTATPLRITSASGRTNRAGRPSRLYNRVTLGSQSRHPSRRLRGHRADRRRGHGPGVSGDGHQAETSGCDQDPAAITGR